MRRVSAGGAGRKLGFRHFISTKSKVERRRRIGRNLRLLLYHYYQFNDSAGGALAEWNSAEGGEEGEEGVAEGLFPN